jgi:hypothetical protein
MVAGAWREVRAAKVSDGPENVLPVAGLRTVALWLGRRGYLTGLLSTRWTGGKEQQQENGGT